MSEEVKKVAEVQPAKKVEKASAVKVVETKEPVIAKPKFVKVIPKFSGTRFIGGKWYSFVLDKEIEVTEDAKQSLKQSGAIYL